MPKVRAKRFYAKDKTVEQQVKVKIMKLNKRFLVMSFFPILITISIISKLV